MPFNSDYTVGQEIFFFVHPDHRGTIGDSLIKQAEQDLKGEVDILAFSELLTSTDMLEYYNSRGYTLTENTYSRIL